MKTKYLSIPLLLNLDLWRFCQTRKRRPATGWGYSGLRRQKGPMRLRILPTGLRIRETGWYSAVTDNSGSYNTAVGAGTPSYSTTESKTRATGCGGAFKQYHGTGNTATGVAALLTTRPATSIRHWH